MSRCKVEEICPPLGRPISRMAPGYGRSVDLWTTILMNFPVVTAENMVADSAAVSFLEQFTAEHAHQQEHEVEQVQQHQQQVSQLPAIPVREVQRCDLDKLPGSKVDLSFSVSVLPPLLP